MDESNNSSQNLISDILHSLRTTLGMEVAFVSEFRDGRRIFRYVDADKSFSPISVGQSHPLDESYCQRIINKQLPELICDVNQEPIALAIPATTLFPIGAYLGVPINLSNGDLYGTFCSFNSKPSSLLSESELGLMRFIAQLTGTLIEKDLMRTRSVEETRSRLQTVIEQCLFEIHYQPIINIALGVLVGHEALTRFNVEPRRSPDHWFNEALDVGLNEALEVATMKRALQGLEYFPKDTYVSINISPATILLDVLNDVLTGYDLSRVVLEVTEHTSVDDYEEIASRLYPFRKRGLRLAVDDAGAGFASFKHILKLKPDVIKLDKSLIDNIDTDQGCRALAAALIRFAEEMGSKIVAEGVETELQLRVLRELNVDKAQGYLLGKPQPLSLD